MMITRAVLYAVFLLYLLVGTTYNGILDPQVRLAGVVGLAIGAAAWGVVRWRKRWRWHATALDGVILVWIAAFTLSLIANLETWRRIAIGLWYVGVYIGVWYVMHDLLANRAIRRGVLINALLLTGALVIAFGYLQIRMWLTDMLPLMLNGTLPFNLPRPVSTLGNPNTLGAFLAVLLPMALYGVYVGRRFRRVVMALYSVLLLGLLVLSYSRGAWVGAAAGVALQVILLLRANGWLNPRRWLAWWASQRLLTRSGAVVAGLLVIAIAVAGTVIILNTYLTPGGRSADTRNWIYNGALATFNAQPITGAGLFTFGAGLARVYGSPPSEPHAHAHNIILHIAAELGVVGLLALALTAFVSVRAFWRNLVASRDPALIAGAAGFTAFAAHHLFDVPSMVPAIALMGLTALVIATAPIKPIALTGPRRAITAAAIAVVGVGLVVTGIWSATTYSRYTEILYQAAGGAISPAEAARRMQSVIDADPAMPVYHYQQGMLYGLAGDEVSTQAAIVAFDAYSRLAPDYGGGWINQFALHERLGEREQAFAALTEAVERSTSEWTLQYQFGEYLEAAGEDEAAYEAYQAALRRMPDARLMPEWGQTPIQERMTREAPPLSGAGETIRLLEAGEAAAARQLWDASNYRVITTNPTSAYSIDVLLALHERDRARAVDALDGARSLIQTTGDVAWTRWASACLAKYDGDETAAPIELQAAQDSLVLEPFAADWNVGMNIAHIQFLRLALPRQFLPEADYAIVSPLLRYLLAKPEPCLF